MNKITEQIGQRIRTYRINMGLSQEQLAEKCNLHPTYVGQLERGEKNATVLTIEKIASGLEIQIVDLFEKITSENVVPSIPEKSYQLISSLPLDKQEELWEIEQVIAKMIGYEYQNFSF